MDKLNTIYAFIKEFYIAKFLPLKSRRQLEARQQQLWQDLKRSALCQSEFYLPFINKPHSEWPVINKAEHMAAFNKVNTAGLDRATVLQVAEQSELSRDFSSQLGDYSVGLSSGTSGNRGVFVASKKERVIWAANIVAKVLPIGFAKRRIAFFLRANNKLYETVNSPIIKFEFFDLLIDIEEHIKQLNDYQPNILIAPASVLSILADAMGDKLMIKPIKVISVAEVLINEDKQKIERKFNQIVHQVYQCTEATYSAALQVVECCQAVTGC